VLGGVPGGGQRAQGEPTEVDLLAVLQPAMGKAEPACAGRQDLSAVGGSELAGAGEEIGV
jgi:hypothetical protein